MNKNILILLFPLIICGCNSTSTTTTSSTSLYLGEYGDIMNDFLPNEGEVKLLFKHSEEETVGDDGEDYFYNYCPSIFIENNKEYYRSIGINSAKEFMDAYNEAKETYDEDEASRRAEIQQKESFQNEVDSLASSLDVDSDAVERYVE